MTAPPSADEVAAVIGPRVNPYLNKELPEHQWTMCRGCPSFRVFDWHYHYCRHLGDQAKPDQWNEGWLRIDPEHNEVEPPPCGLPVVNHLIGETL